MDSWKVASKEASINPGDVLQDCYRILHPIGSGVSDNKFLAEDIEQKNQFYLIEIFAPKLIKNTEIGNFEERFKQEIDSLFGLQHSQIPKYRELLRFQKGEKQYLFLVQDYVKGNTYQQLLDYRLKASQKFKEAEIKIFLKNVLQVLDYCHSKGVIHCNISPENIILREEDQLPILVNFGGVKKAEKKMRSHFNKKKLANNTFPFVGTTLEIAGFAPREQVEQDTVIAQNDLYSLAATAVVLLTGKEPEKLVNLSQYRWNWRSEVSITPMLDMLLNKMLAPNPSERFNSVAEVIKKLESISYKNLLPVLSGINGISSFKPFQSSSLRPFQTSSFKTKVKPHSFRQNFSRRILLLPLISMGLWVTYAYPEQLAKLPGFSIKSLSTERLPNSLKASEWNNSALPNDLRSRFSSGERILISQQSSNEKKNAAQIFARGEYSRAASLFFGSLKSQPNDPEALIYFNNALIGEEQSYTISVPVPISANTESAKEILRGVAQAQYQINQSGGMNKIPLKIQIVDDNGSVGVAQQVATALVENPEILGVIGHHTSEMTLATAKIYEKSSLVTISPISSSAKLSNYSPFVFRTIPSDHIAAKALANHVRYKRQKRKVAIFYNSQSDRSESLKSEFKSAVSLVGAKVVSVFDLSDPNFDAERSFEQALNNGAEVLMLSTNQDKLDKALQVINVNNQRLELLGGDDLFTSKTLRVATKSVENMIVAVPWHRNHNPDSDFVQIAQTLWEGEISWRTAMAYDATRAWISAIENNRNPTRLKLQKTIANPRFSTPGVDREIRFTLSGDPIGKIHLVEIKRADNNYGYKFNPLTTSSFLLSKFPQ